MEGRSVSRQINSVNTQGIKHLNPDLVSEEHCEQRERICVYKNKL